MVASTIAISSDSSDESLGSPPFRVILFGHIPTVIPSISMVAPETSTSTLVISSAAPVIEMTIVALPTGLSTSPFLYTDSPEASDGPPSQDLYAIIVARWRSSITARSSSPSDFPIAHTIAYLLLVHLQILHQFILRVGCTSDAFHHWCAAPLSTFYPPTTSESSSGDSSERPLHSSSHSAGPSRKRYRSSAHYVPSPTPVTGSLAPTHADLLLSSDDREEFEANARDTVVLGIDPRSVQMVDEEIIEPVGGDSSSSSSTRDGTVRLVEDIPTVEADQMIASGERERAGMAESIRSLRSKNLKIRDDRDDLRRKLRRLESFAERRLGFLL
nr:hypothetical protein [Tanacetum cinerariifolium]